MRKFTIPARWIAIFGISALVAVLHAVPPVSAADRPAFYAGKVQFSCAPSTIIITPPLVGMVIDTSEGFDRDSLPNWRLIGALKIDSVIYIDSTRPLITSEQLNGLRISDSSLVRAIDEINVYKLVKYFPSSIPFDTIWWDSARGRNVSLPDLSKWHMFYFSPQKQIKDVVEKITIIDGLKHVSGIPIYYQVDDE